LQDHGQISSSPSGGDRRSGRVEAQLDYLLGLIHRTPDIPLLEIQERLIQNCGEHFSVSVLWRFFDRHRVTFKKRPRMKRSSGSRTFWRQRGDRFASQLDLDPANSMDRKPSTTAGGASGYWYLRRHRPVVFPALIGHLPNRTSRAARPRRGCDRAYGQKARPGLARSRSRERVTFRRRC
jgi:hypothetical protein